MGSLFVVTLGDVIQIGVLAFVVLVVVIVSLVQWTRQAWCKHDGGVYETSACDAICRKCGKNLGFIGTWRSKP